MDRAEPLIAILSDFGYRDHYAGVMKGAIARIAPRARIIDLTHGIPAQAIAAGALVLAQSWRYFPARTIFLAVVDPGVGTTRLPIAIETRAGARFVGPDNGLLARAAAEAGVRRMVELKSPRFRLADASSTFHGRDIFAPAAAWLARGASIRALGPAIDELTPLVLPEPSVTARRIRGEVLYIDGFGNLITNISASILARLAACFRTKPLSVRINGSAPIKIYRAYGDAPADSSLATVGGFNLLEIAIRDASAARHYRVQAGASVVVTAGRA
ncbi:MAG TPA: SAM-dependent chlorinase/fluorinase [Candidatus Binataceae bacterium]|nr:SAM-dependent chlorinase/fluorinase [Candidatus Binataceae bacterium]